MRTLIQALKTKELRKKILFVLFIIIVYRIGSFIPTPGVDYNVVNKCMATMGSASQENFIGLVNLFSGGAMLQLSIFALGVMPYITASIVVQLLRVVIPRFEALHKEGQSGEAKLTQYTRYLTIGLAVLQSTTILVTARSGALFNYRCDQVIPDGSVFNLVVMVLIMTGGTGLIMWMAELVTDKGIGQGMSILIFMSICSGFLPQLWEIGYGTNGKNGDWTKFGIVVGVLVVILIFVDFVELCQRRVPVQYTRRMIGRKMYGGSSTYLPLKINMSGVIPPIFASSILAIPTLIAQFGKSDQSWVKWINANLANTTSVWYIALYALMIVFFCFFYTSITFNPDETADNMKQYGGFIPGIRAGNATSRYLTYVMNRLNTVGAVYLLFVALIPTVLIMALGLNAKLPFGGTTILIIAGVGLDTLRQAKAQTEQFQYTGFLFENVDHKEG
ncbi:preprotein translocase subunit SecY [Bifidobacterium longum]|uniref:preprotein translocase subunit SecY n=1 Tax=Bifidobacterium longum TaxID=216816 RepID=UPI000D56A1D6|nr:preprotein translocase subunit SecY [Bifidobacterium longum]PVV63670.1 preprotein translocase subunit SecY [Bifidobacterium longum subsp. longum]TCD80803.1 Protein translocase subunit secY [Bifidobacterium longum subsp. longum]TCE23103.1 Protein translocase subunit secY [Bifidobacterium longum subsp. longum]TCF37903.1 Protein translocase subunit secY [Bifidobacterium longum subsp. longum]